MRTAFKRLTDGLAKMREQVTERVDDLLASAHRIDDSLFEDLEELLITADIGVETALWLTDALRERAKKQRLTDAGQLRQVLQQLLLEILDKPTDLSLPGSNAVILVVGVNGSGKTTSIGKLSAQLKAAGREVLIAAADTFRAAAVEQLEVWARRAGVDIVKHQPGADPAAVVYDALQASAARGIDTVIVDTAGRLHTKVNLMKELEKIAKVIKSEAPGEPSEVLIVVDATSGLNALEQARMFSEAVDVTGIILTKLDGTAKGGVVLAIAKQLGIPVKFIGIGEGLEDLQPFDPGAFVEALFLGG